MPRAATPDPATTEEVARRYFAAVAARDVDEMVACWRAGGVDRLHGQADLVAPDGVRAWFEELFAALPDCAFEVLETTAQEDRCAVRWRLTGTFAGPGDWQGFAATGSRVDVQGCDVVRVADGLVAGNEAYVDGMTIARQIGALPPRESGAERGLTALTNLRTRLARRFAAGDPEPIADGVWVVRGGFPRRVMNVYFVRDGDGVLLFDAGVKSMTPALAQIGAQLGGITRIVLGHGHADHRGAAPGLGAPVWCHPDEVADAEGDGGAHYFDLTQLDMHGKLLLRRLLPIWDGGPVLDRRHRRGGRRGRRLQSCPPAGPRARADRPVARVRPTRTRERLLLHARPADRDPRRGARAPSRLQQGHRAGARLDAQARRARPRDRLERPRRAAARRRRGAAGARGGDDLRGRVAPRGSRIRRREITDPPGGYCRSTGPKLQIYRSSIADQRADFCGSAG